MNQKITAEFLGSAFLLMIVVGSGIMGEQLASGNEAIALLANSIATGAGLYVLIQCLGPISGAHFNPAVSFVKMLWGSLSKRDFIFYLTAQFSGAITGVLLTHAMFHQAIIQSSSKNRADINFFLSEVIATFGLISTIKLSGRNRIEILPMSIALYITAAYWFTSSTSFANPSVTMARAFTNTFCGIEPNGVLPFILAQFIGATLAFFLLKKSYVKS